MDIWKRSNGMRFSQGQIAHGVKHDAKQDRVPHCALKCS